MMPHAPSIPSSSSSRTTSTRNRLTVFFRLILAIPHIIWLFLWTIAVVLRRDHELDRDAHPGSRPAGPAPLHLPYVRYLVHLDAYLWLVANPYPGFVGEEGEYPIDVRLPPPEPQPRWKTLLPASCSPCRRSSSPPRSAAGQRRGLRQARGGGTGPRLQAASGLGSAVGVLGWFASLARGRMPKGLRDAGAYSVGYSAQVLAYAAARDRPLSERRPDRDARRRRTAAAPSGASRRRRATICAARASRSSSGSCSRSRTSSGSCSGRSRRSSSRSSTGS